eukprot:scaffold127714_cov16-Tisochrysis_lutea.AAC.1
MPGSVHRNRSMVAVHKGSVHRNRAWSEAGTQPPALQLASYQQLCCMTMSQACQLEGNALDILNSDPKKLHSCIH